MCEEYRETLVLYESCLREEERSSGTIEKYMRDIRKFLCFLDGRELTKELVAEWKASLLQEGYAPVTIATLPVRSNNSFVCFISVFPYSISCRRIFRIPVRNRQNPSSVPPRQYAIKTHPSAVKNAAG